VVTIADSDLGRLPVITQLYNLLHLNTDVVQPTGRTQAVLSLDGDALELSRLHQFNRGADVVASVTADNIWLGKDSPIHGVAAGGLRPLRDVAVPFASELDRLLRALQANSVSIVIGGTLGNHTTRVVPFSDIGEAVGRLLGVPEE
jgi:hypothetical protein